MERCKTLVACGRLIAVVCQGEPTDGVLLIDPHADAIIGGHHCVVAALCLKSCGRCCSRLRSRRLREGIFAALRIGSKVYDERGE